MIDQQKSMKRVNEMQSKEERGKRWLMVGAFVLLAGTLFTLFWMMDAEQSELTPVLSDNVDEGSDVDEPVVSNGDGTEVVWPVKEKQSVTVTGTFYDEKGTEAERLAGLIQSGNTYTARTGINLADQSNSMFEVVAAQAGQVTVVERHPLIGNIIEIQHDNGLTTVYQSLSETSVKVGDEVSQGATIGKAGRSELEKEAGNHLYFAVKQDGQWINPQSLLK